MISEAEKMLEKSTCAHEHDRGYDHDNGVARDKNDKSEDLRRTAPMELSKRELK